MRTPAQTARTQLEFAASAAIAASLGDLLMVHVAIGNTPLDTLSGRLFLMLGGALGVLAIPIYYTGYAACRAVYLPNEVRAARGFLVFAVLVAVFGAFTHGWTAFDIFNALSSGAITRPPEEAVVASLPLAVAAAVAAFACLGATVTLLLEARRKNHRLFGQLAWINPISGTIVLTVLAPLASGIGQYVAPAAPNLAHAFFFAMCAYLLGDIPYPDASPTVD